MLMNLAYNPSRVLIRNKTFGFEHISVLTIATAI